MFGDAYLDIPTFNFLSLIYELDLYEDFLPFCAESTEKMQIGRAGKIAHIKFKVAKF